MGLSMYLEMRNEIDDSDEIGYWGKSAYPLHHKIVSYVGQIDDSCEVELSKEILLKLRDDFIDILQKATDGQVVTDKEYIKQHLRIFEDEDIDEFFVRWIIHTIDVFNRAIYFADFDKDKVFYYYT